MSASEEEVMDFAKSLNPWGEQPEEVAMEAAQDILSQEPPQESSRPREGSPKPSKTPKELLLETRASTSTSHLKGGPAEVVLITLENDGAGVFKSHAEEPEICSRPGVNVGTFFLRERAAYLVDYYLGFDLVPPTVIRTENGAYGSFQEFVPDSKTGKQSGFTSSQYPPSSRDEFYRMWVFDYLIHNTDRHSGNFLLQGDRVVAIDNGLSFTDDERFLILYGHFNDEAASESVVKIFSDMVADPSRLEQLAGELRLLLPENQVIAFLYRVQKIQGYILGSGKVPGSELDLDKYAILHG
jgi:hypothetical protein